jgi:hypothetical protein
MAGQPLSGQCTGAGQRARFAWPIVAGTSAAGGLATPLLQATHAIFEHQLALIVDPMQFDASEPLPSPEHYLYWALIGQRQRFAWPRTLRCCRTGQRSAYAAPPSQRTGRPRALFAATPVQSLAC